MIKKGIIIPLSLLLISVVIYSCTVKECNRKIASDRLIDKDYEEVIKDKIWVHRVNSIERLKETSPLYNGVEVDIMYMPDEKYFDVYHPPAASIGLTLYDYLKSNPDTSTNFWLDLKNLSNTIAADAVDRLLYICKDLSLSKDKFIVESNNTKELQIFSDSGFRTSYYVHYPGLYTLSEDDLKTELDKVKENMKYETTYISSPFHDYEILKQQFPDKEKLLWMAESKLKFRDDWEKNLYTMKVASDPKVKVLLHWVVMDAKIL